MTVGVVIKCDDGIVLACDSMATFSRGVPVTRYTNKVFVIDHEVLNSPIAIVGAGMTAFVDKFIDRSNRLLAEFFDKKPSQKLDIVDFSENVCEPIGSILFKEYVIDRYKFFGTSISDYSLSLIITGACHDNELRTYFVDHAGLTEAIEDYGTIGSGAAYAELFLKNLIPDPLKITIKEAAPLSVYAIKGVEIMDPFVGGRTSVKILSIVNNKLKVASFPKSKIPKNAQKKMELVLSEMGDNMRSLVT